MKDPALTMSELELADSTINFAVRALGKEGDYWYVRFDTQEKINQRFDEKGISIPFPQQDVHLINAS